MRFGKGGEPKHAGAHPPHKVSLFLFLIFSFSSATISYRGLLQSPSSAYINDVAAGISPAAEPNLPTSNAPNYSSARLNFLLSSFSSSTLTPSSFSSSSSLAASAPSTMARSS
eukprot:GHVT01065314.1.p1 GENE.GHVT01065314.1~~GHVT01065314.1.p1  ORF type:complete len:113 (-),score=30.53 GHVT01065314.1:209-547(-)